MNTTTIATRLLLGLTAFTMLTGARGCSFATSTGGYTTYTDAPTTPPLEVMRK